MMKHEGIDFVMELHERFGLLDAHRIASEYLECPIREENTDELEFRKGVMEGIHMLDLI